MGMREWGTKGRRRIMAEAVRPLGEQARADGGWGTRRARPTGSPSTAVPYFFSHFNSGCQSA